MFDRFFKLSLFNFFIIACLGLLMRYKIAFYLPFFEQKYLQHAHSHFAFSGWISLFFMTSISLWLNKNSNDKNSKQFILILFFQTACSFAMLFAFAAQGYALFSIIFSVLSILIFIWFAVLYFIKSRNIKLPSKSWFSAAIFFHFISFLGTFSLTRMMATHQFDQNWYLASVYMYLHFQYNGWFFFACMGLFIDYLDNIQLLPKNHKLIFMLFFLSCIPAFGLSLLWLNLAFAYVLIIALSALMQMLAFIIFSSYLIKQKFYNLFNLSQKIMLIFIFLAFTFKFTLQLLSTFPALSTLAFGIRPIVIAYMHLVFLACFSTFIIFYLQMLRKIFFKSIFIYLFLGFILLNELILGIQGFTAIFYYPLPYVNHILVFISLGLVISIFCIFIDFIRKS